MKALFISKNDLVKQTPLSANIDFDKVSHFVQIAQDIHVHQILGSKLYDRLQADVINGTLAGDYSTLVYDYIKPTLVQYSFMEYLPFSQYTISNKGVFKHTSENAALPSDKEVDAMRDAARDTVSFGGTITGNLVFEGSTSDSFETTLAVTDPTADRTITLPNATGTVSLITATETLTNKTLTSPTLTSPVFNTGVSGTAVLDEDDMASNSATKVVTQQSFKKYVDDTIAAQDLDIAPDSGTGQSILLPSETLTFAGGSNIGSSATSNTVTFAISDVVQLTASQTLSNKTFTSPTINTMTFASGQLSSGLNIGSGGIVFEGATADAHETTLTAEDPTQDNTITIPDSDMTAVTTATHATKAVHIARAIALG